MFPTWILAGLWGFLAGSALLIGGFAGYFFKIPQRVVAAVMAFGSGVLLSTISFELMDEAYKLGGFYDVTVGFFGGAVLFTIINVYLSRKGAKHRKHSVKTVRSKESVEESGLAIAAGSIIDGIPESIAIGLTMIEGEL